MFDVRWSRPRYRLSEIELDEVSLVDTPAHPMAKTVLAKSDPGASAVHVPVPLGGEAGLRRLDGEKVGKRTYTEEERRRLAAKGQAMPDGSFPIPDVDALKDAIQSIGRTGPAKRPRVIAFIKRRAAALGKTDLIPTEWMTGGASVEKSFGRRAYDQQKEAQQPPPPAQFGERRQNPFTQLTPQVNPAHPAPAQAPSQQTSQQSPPPQQQNPFAQLRDQVRQPEREPERPGEREPEKPEEREPEAQKPGAPPEKKESPDEIRQRFLERLKMRRKETG